MAEERRWNRIRGSEGFVFVVLFVLAALGFTAVSTLTHSFRARQKRVAGALYTRGMSEMKYGRDVNAAKSFRAALDFAPDNVPSQLALAEALMVSKRYGEAMAYLEVLWERQPENGEVNLDMARNFAAQGETNQAIRHYQNAIYSVWRTDPDANRRTVRLELVHYLLSRNANTQAEAELIALAGNLPENATLRNQVAALFMEVKNYSRALNQYQRVLSIDPQNQEALAGAGRAAFLARQYGTAQDYLMQATQRKTDDPELLQLLQSTRLVLSMDPFARNVSDADRRQRVLDVFQIAGARLASCNPASHESLRNVNQQWQALKTKASDQALKRDTELANVLMEIAFAIEREAEGVCGPASDKDLALRLLSKDHDEVER